MPTDAAGVGVQHSNTATSSTASTSERIPSATDLPQGPRATALPTVRIEGIGSVRVPTRTRASSSCKCPVVRNHAQPWTHSTHGTIRRAAPAAILHDGTLVRQRVPS
jgi:hypothetical protein